MFKMQKTEILIVGTNESIMKTIARLIDSNEKWLATIAFSMDEAVHICFSRKFDLALICAGLEKDEERILTEKLKHLWPNLPVVRHYGGGSGLLYTEIYQGLESSYIF